MEAVTTLKDPGTCPYPNVNEGKGHKFDGVVIETYYLALYCQRCGKTIWPQGVRDPDAMDVPPHLKATFADSSYTPYGHQEV